MHESEPGWHDDPISIESEDRLGRVELAKRVAKLVGETYSRDSSVVHGLVGPWGSGKSSVLALVERQVEALDDNWVVVRFSPWATSDLSGLLSEFYGAIAEALPKKRSEAFKRGLAEAMSATAPLLNIAGGLLGTGAVGDAADKGAELLRREKSWASRFSEASEEFAKLDKKLLVIADDVDRLRGDELLDFLKLVRLVGRFPGMSYLIAYDEDGLLASIESAGAAVENNERARDFLEKFVQYPVYVPPLIESQVFALLNDALSTAISESSHRYSSESGRLSFAFAWTELLDSPRAINRFAAQIRLVLPLHSAGEVDLEDVILLTLLRLHAPSVYKAIGRQKSILTKARGKDDFDWTTIIDADLPIGIARALKEIVSRLFPATSPRGDDQVIGPRAANSDYFDRYFLQGIPEEDIADSWIRDAVTAADGGSPQFLDALLRSSTSDARLEVIFRKLHQLADWGEGATVTPIGALEAIVVHLGDLPRRTDSVLPGAYPLVRQWVGQMLLRLPEDISEAKVLELFGSAAAPDLRSLFLETAAFPGDVVAAPGVKDAAVSESLALVEIALDNARKGDSADSPEELEHWTVAHSIAPTEARALIARALDEGLNPDDLAARFVFVSRWRGSSAGVRVQIGGIHWEAAEDLLPDGFQVSAPPDLKFDDNDLTWGSRRKFAQVAFSQRKPTAES